MPNVVASLLPGMQKEIFAEVNTKRTLMTTHSWPITQSVKKKEKLYIVSRMNKFQTVYRQWTKLEGSVYATDTVIYRNICHVNLLSLLPRGAHTE